jgi:hypothetical protein
VSNLAKWKNGQWSDVGGGTSDNILKLAAFNHPSGAGLYVGGTFTGVGPGGSVPANEVARWDGQGWTALDVGVSHPTVATVGAMAVYDDGRGQSLFIAGGFTTAGGLPAGNIARWGCDPCYANCDGSTAAPVLNVNDFICFQNKYAAGDSGANCDGSTIPPVLNVNDFVCFQTRYAQGCP